jgi:hypothetical protein
MREKRNNSIAGYTQGVLLPGSSIQSQNNNTGL